MKVKITIIVDKDEGTKDGNIERYFKKATEQAFRKITKEAFWKGDKAIIKVEEVKDAN